MGHAQRSYDTSFASRVVGGGNWVPVQLARLSSILPFRSREKRLLSVASQHSVRGLTQLPAQLHRTFSTPWATFSVDALSPSRTTGDSQTACGNGYYRPSVISNPVTLVFEVEDTGHGIAVEDREAMFQNFVSLPNTSTRYGGTGVGLGIVRSLVQLMGGSIRIVDKVTPGTLFRFDISLERQEEPEVAERAPPRVERVCAAPDLVPLLGSGGAGLMPRRVFPRSHWDAAKWSSIDKAVSNTLLQTPRRVLLVMPRGEMQSKVAATWFERRGCQVAMESSWEGMRAAMEAMTHRHVKQTELRNNKPDVAQGNVDEKDGKVNKDGSFRCLVLIDSALILHEQEVSLALCQLGSLRADIDRIEDQLSLSTGDLHNCTPPGISTALLVTAATHPSLQRQARSNGCTLLQKPLISSRLTPLLTFFDSSTHSADRERTFPVPSSQNTSEIAPAHPPHKTNDAESLHKVSNFVFYISREDDAECAHEDESQRALKEPDVSTSPRDQGTNFDGSITGEREQQEYLTAHMQLDTSSSGSIRQDKKEDVKRDTGTVVVEVEGRRSDVREGSLCGDKKGVPQTPHLNQVEDFTGLRILLVEDTPVMAQIATRQMEKIGAKVRWAQDGQIAVEIFTEIYGDQRRETEAEQIPKSSPWKPVSFDDGFDVIVMDCQMPRLDGYGATAAIRELEKVLGIHTPIVALTAHAMTPDRKKCLDAGMDEYLTKPLNLALFKATLAKLLKREDS